MRKLAGYGLIYLCALLDWIPSYEEGEWYFGCWGCRWGIAKKGFDLLEVRREF